MIHLGAGSIAAIGAAAFAAAAINAAAGGGSLVSFPVLLAMGLPPLNANVSNTIGLLPGYAGGSAAYRRELSHQGGRVLVLGAVSVVGAVGGAALLLRSGGAVFERVVPWLILAACAVLAAQQPLLGVLRHRRRTASAAGPLLLVGDGLAAVYGAFFGAGLGVLLLAVLGLFLRDDLQRLNALKGVLSLVINAVAAMAFAVFAPVDWGVALVMVPAALLGGVAGVLAGRRLDAGTLRTLVVLFGVAVAVRLLV